MNIRFILKNCRGISNVFVLSAAILALFFIAGCSAGDNLDNESEGYGMMHEMMVAQQIEARGITNSNVLAAMRKVERHLFVPEHLQHLAYGDHPLPTGEGQTISQPYIVALMTLVI